MTISGSGNRESIVCTSFRVALPSRVLKTSRCTFQAQNWIQRNQGDDCEGKERAEN